MDGIKANGDFQTPLSFAQKVCEYVYKNFAIDPKVILEPTCGKGSFLVATSGLWSNARLYGIELSPDYCQETQRKLVGKNVSLYCENVFQFDFAQITQGFSPETEFLLIGNPPWVNNAMLSVLQSGNLPSKSNFKQLKGIDAITGSSNFDICESVLLKLAESFPDRRVTFAFLCKTSVARNVFQELIRRDLFVHLARVVPFDSREVFGVSCDACLFVFQLNYGVNRVQTCQVSSFEGEEGMAFGYRNGKFYSKLGGEVAKLDGCSCFAWRQGVKHDLSKVMELSFENGCLRNGFGECIDIEDALVFPLIKSSDFKSPIITQFKRFVLVPQRKPNTQTGWIEEQLPKTWRYLTQYRDLFQQRKSIIYKNSPDFSIFGVGEYSFQKYKVAISGFYKTPFFSLLYSSKPVMIDDTCYAICFDDLESAYTAMVLLNTEKVQSFLSSIAFLDSKRPYTKKVLSRIDFQKLMRLVSLDDLKNTEKRLGCPPYINDWYLEYFKKLILTRYEPDLLELSRVTF